MIYSALLLILPLFYNLHLKFTAGTGFAANAEPFSNTDLINIR